MSDNDRKWFHSGRTEAEVWEGPCDTKAAAIAAGTTEYEGAPFWIRDGHQITIKDLLGGLDLAEILQRLDEHWGDNYSYREDSDEMVTADDGAQAALEAWAVEHLQCEPWWECDGEPEAVVVTP